jgi:hypothetical protein
MRPLDLFRGPRRAVFWALGLILPFLSGCESGVLATKQRVYVDAITAPPEVLREAGPSYHLTAQRAMVAGQQASLPAIAACVNAALAGRGLFEAQPTAVPDLFIEVTYGRNALPREVQYGNEVHLRLVARRNLARTVLQTESEEVWDVRVGVPGVNARLESAMPLLATVASEHIGKDTQSEVPFDMLKNSPAVQAVRDTATRALGLPTTSAKPSSGAAARPAGGEPQPSAPPSAAEPPAKP